MVAASYHITIVTQARTVNALLKNYYIALTVRCFLSVRLVPINQDSLRTILSTVEGLTDRSPPLLAGLSVIRASNSTSPYASFCF